MPDKFYVDLSKIDEYAKFLKKSIDLMEDASYIMMKKNREIGGVLEDAVTSRIDEELRIMQRNVEYIKKELEYVTSDVKKAAELYQIYLQRGDIV